MDCSLPGFYVHGILQARIVEWVATSFSRGSSWPRNQTQVSCIAGMFFTNWALREALFFNIRSDQIRSVTQSCPTLCDPLCTPGLPVHYQLPDFTQTHVHQVSDAIQPSHPLVPFSSCPQSFPASGSFPTNQFFISRGQSIGASALASVLPMNTQDWSPLEWTGWISLHSKDAQESYPTPQFKSINSSVLSLLHSPTLTSIHDHWKNHNLD